MLIWLEWQPQYMYTVFSENILSLGINVFKKIERISNRWGILQNSYTQTRKEGFFDLLKIIKFNIQHVHFLIS